MKHSGIQRLMAHGMGASKYPNRMTMKGRKNADMANEVMGRLSFGIAVIAGTR